MKKFRANAITGVNLTVKPLPRLAINDSVGELFLNKKLDKINNLWVEEILSSKRSLN